MTNTLLESKAHTRNSEYYNSSRYRRSRWRTKNDIAKKLHHSWLWSSIHTIMVGLAAPGEILVPCSQAGDGGSYVTTFLEPSSRKASSRTCWRRVSLIIRMMNVEATSLSWWRSQVEAAASESIVGSSFIGHTMYLIIVGWWPCVVVAL
jgi:hypothetical protein